MNNENLIAYLNDHLAGSVGALELLAHMSKSAKEDDFRLFCTSLFNEIESDQSILNGLISQLGGEGGAIKKAAAWLIEKCGWTEITLAGVDKDQLGRLQVLEGLALGIAGKKALWLSLSAIVHLSPALESVDITRLITRAEEQIERVEAVRLRVVKSAFS
jgi:hypothetical protein